MSLSCVSVEFVGVLIVKTEVISKISQYSGRSKKKREVNDRTMAHKVSQFFDYAPLFS